MSFQRKVRGVIIGGILILSAGVSNLYAAWWDKAGLSLSVPPGVEEVSKERRKISNSEFEVSYYKTNLSIDEVKKYYYSRLPNLGWREKQIFDQSTLANMKIDIANSPMVNNLVFENDNKETLMINFLPGGLSQGAKTAFTLYRGKLDFSQSLPPGNNNYMPELIAKPKKDVFPVYPGASLVFLSEPADSLKASYFSKDDLDLVADFYKSNMPKYGWSLTEEKLPEKIETTGGADSCPSCPKGAGSSSQQIEIWNTQLFFSNQKENSCNIVLSRVIPLQGIPESFSTTTIMVNYEEKGK